MSLKKFIPVCAKRYLYIGYQCWNNIHWRRWSVNYKWFFIACFKQAKKKKFFLGEAIYLQLLKKESFESVSVDIDISRLRTSIDIRSTSRSLTIATTATATTTSGTTTSVSTSLRMTSLRWSIGFTIGFVSRWLRWFAFCGGSVWLVMSTGLGFYWCVILLSTVWLLLVLTVTATSVWPRRTASGNGSGMSNSGSDSGPLSLAYKKNSVSIRKLLQNFA